MVFKHTHLFPIIVGGWFIFTFLLTYCIAVLKDDVVPVFPYISDTGTWAPESCIFGLLLNIGSVLMAGVMYIRYRQVRYLVEKNNFNNNISLLNQVSSYLGYLAAFGICIVGNFQETNVFSVHILGALLSFGLGSLYQCIQTGICFLMYPTIGNKKTNILRIICSVICILTFLGCFIFAGLSLKQFQGEDRTKWRKEDGGYKFHFISSVAEWILALFTVVYLITFTEDFKGISISEPEFVI